MRQTPETMDMSASIKNLGIVSCTYDNRTSGSQVSCLSKRERPNSNIILPVMAELMARVLLVRMCCCEGIMLCKVILLSFST